MDCTFAIIGIIGLLMVFVAGVGGSCPFVEKELLGQIISLHPALSLEKKLAKINLGIT